MQIGADPDIPSSRANKVAETSDLREGTSGPKIGRKAALVLAPRLWGQFQLAAANDNAPKSGDEPDGGAGKA